MNKTIGVTSSSPAYVFKFIKAIYDGAVAQGLSEKDLLDTICNMVIGSAELIKSGRGTPEELISAVASKGGTTERALAVLNDNNFDKIVIDAMKACTDRANELGKIE
jgi:pyrroline-5-carboxylate reductase